MFDPFAQFLYCVALGGVFGISWPSEKWFFVIPKWICRILSGLVVGIALIGNMAQHYLVGELTIVAGFILGARLGHMISEMIVGRLRRRVHPTQDSISESKF